MDVGKDINMQKVGDLNGGKINNNSNAAAVVSSVTTIDPYGVRPMRQLHQRLQQEPLPDISYRNISIDTLPRVLRDYIEEKARICQPDDIHICDGSKEEYDDMLRILQEAECAIPLKKMKDCWLTLTDPLDVARVESRTVICTKNQLDTIPTPKSGFKPAPTSANLRNLKMSQLGNWMSPEDFQYEVERRFPGCMRGRTMYVIPYSMGPIGSPISKIGVELTDSAYVACSMRIMTRMGKEVLDVIAKHPEFVKCLHSVGVPLPNERKLVNNWACNPEMTMIGHLPENNEVISFGSGYGGNSLLGKKCFALRLGSNLGKREGWLAEHMLILGITNPQGVKKYITAAFPSQCGKTNLAMLEPTLPGWKLECVGDDIAWMKFDENGVLRAINPEAGFFGVAPGTSSKTNPMALKTVQSNTLFTNVAYTTDGDVYWEGMEEKDFRLAPGAKIISWKGKEWASDSKEPSAHSNSRFCTPASQCPIIDPNWLKPEGVPISAIIFGGRRPQGIPLIYETFSWEHGVFVGSCVKSEATSAAEYKGKVIMHDPFAMRPFFGYNFGDYMAHWLSLNKPGRQMPKIFHVNWFRKSTETGKFLWPGFCDNVRVLEWIVRRCCGDESIVRETAIGRMPTLDSINLKGLEGEVSRKNLEELFSLDKKFLQEEVDEIRQYIDECVNESTPAEIYKQLDQFQQRVEQME